MQEQVISRNLAVEIKVPEQTVASTYKASTKYAPTNEEELREAIHRYAALGYNYKVFDQWALNILERTTLANVESELKGYDKDTKIFHYRVVISFVIVSSDKPEVLTAMNNFAKQVKAKITSMNLEYQSF